MRVEAAALRPLPARRATDFTEIVARVTRTGGFMVKSEDCWINGTGSALPASGSGLR